MYDAIAAGSSQWTETQSVTLSQGLFQVQLGDNNLNPFAANLFDIPLWLGMAIDLDPEMSPRTSLSSVGYALKAEDADTLGGLDPVDLDQSAHLGDTANPHSVTAAQTGAASIASLSAHTSNSANPHNVTAAQAGAASAADLNTHSSSPSSHHSRYTNNEAIAAMRPKADTNALNHNRYTNKLAIAAIKADAGTGLNADTVDNLHANEIIDAASDEVRTPISSLPFSITASGSYYITQPLDGSGGGITINVNDVSIDLMGFTLNGNGVNDHGINLGSRSTIVIKNGTIRGFGGAGIYNSALSAANVVNDIQVIANGSLGAGPSHSGIYLVSSSNQVEHCIAKDNGGYGIYVGINSIVKDSRAENSGGLYGIFGGIGSTLSNNTAYNNQGTYGIFGGTGSILSNNTAYLNQGTSSIYGSAGSTLSNNTAYRNQGWGIYAAGPNTVMGNTVYNNNQSQTANQGGLHIGNDTQAENNTVDSNYETGIFVSGRDNILRKNHATDSISVAGVSRCIYFNNNDNAAVDNTATGCTTEFAGSLPPASRFIGNIGW